ncbi:hypothetical protein L210DRAFT_2307366 [Boletus edulis BED1]|uniref:Uncharacterized protein n=1 Tax=Boletus edulis BED1 TaxID=1328754 RepID=A0AAD4BRZ8_BOLED|nr:hypothetical protein L210DRAFT_2307366 [Boletus edulis BED1]
MPHAGTYVLACLISGVSAALILASGPSYTESRSPQGTPYNVNGGRSTYDGCRAGPCQIAYLNSVEDFCLWAPSHPVLSATSSTEHTLVAWCTESAQGSLVIPDGTILGAHLVITTEYVQITGVGKLTNINVPPDGVVSASGQSYSDHRIVVTSVFGQLEQISEWTSFVSQERFCFRACRPSAAASAACPQIHDIFGCSESVSGNYDTGVFEDCIVDGAEVPSALYQEILAAPSHRSAHPFSHCTSRGTIGNAQIAHARRAIAPVLVTSLSQLHLSLSHSTSVSSCMAPTTTDTTTIPMTSSSFPTSTLNATSFMNFSVSSTNAPTYTTCSYNHTHTHTRSHWHSHTHHSSAFSATSSSSSSYHSFSHSPSPRTASSLNDSPSMSLAPSSPIPSTPSFISTFHSSGPLAGTATPFATSASTPLPTPSLPSSSYGTSSSLPGPPTPPSSYGSSTSSSVSSAMSSSVSSSTSSSISSQTTSSSTSYVLTFTTHSLSSVPTTPPASSPSPVSPSTSSSTSAQTSYVLPSTTPSSSDPTASPAPSSPTVPNSQTQIGPQCPPLWNAGTVSSIPLPPLTLAILMIVISSSVGIVVF